MKKILRLEANCSRDLLWGFDIDPDVVSALYSTLCADGAVETSSSPLIHLLQTPKKHTVVIVPRTGRVQLRISYLISFEERASEARHLADEIWSIIDHLPEETGVAD